MEYTAKNYTSICTIPKVIDPEIQTLNQEVQECLFAALKGEEFEDLILVDLFTGLRSGELIGLTWDCIDFENGIIHVKKQLTPPRKKGGGKYYWSALKNNCNLVASWPASFQHIWEYKKSLIFTINCNFSAFSGEIRKNHWSSLWLRLPPLRW